MFIFIIILLIISNFTIECKLHSKTCSRTCFKDNPGLCKIIGMRLSEPHTSDLKDIYIILGRVEHCSWGKQAFLQFGKLMLHHCIWPDHNVFFYSLQSVTSFLISYMICEGSEKLLSIYMHVWKGTAQWSHLRFK